MSIALIPNKVEAQVSFGGCRDARGIPVASIRNDRINDVAYANLDRSGRPIIVYNSRVLSWQAPQTRLFWYGHECGHHALGHTLGRGHRMTGEQAADCFGIVTIVKKGLIKLRDVEVIQRDLSRLGPGDWTHLPGPVRAINLKRCLQEAGLLVDRSRQERRPRRRGFPSGHGMKQCGCWGPNPRVAREPQCASGQVRPNVCRGYCAPGQPVYAWVCR